MLEAGAKHDCILCKNSANLHGERHQPIQMRSRCIAISLGSVCVSSLFAVCSVTSVAQTTLSAKPQRTTHTQHNASGEELAARGKYIVEGIAVCSQCHTPRDGAGAPDRSHWLEGAPVWQKPSEPTEDWPLQAPRIAGTPPGTDGEMVKLLTTGLWRDGKFLRSPMPQFRLSRQDAEAVAAYLKSLQPAPR